MSSILGDNTSGVSDGPATGDDCLAVIGFTSGGSNLVETPSATCPFTGAGDLTGVGPGVGGLADLGCVTPLPDGSCVPVRPLPVESPAVDQGSCTAAGVLEDARETVRPFDVGAIPDAADGCDTGAHELVDVDGNGDDDAFLFTDGFESGDVSGWSS